jgi:hypothetical protein
LNFESFPIPGLEYTIYDATKAVMSLLATLILLAFAGRIATQAPDSPDYGPLNAVFGSQGDPGSADPGSADPPCESSGESPFFLQNMHATVRHSYLPTSESANPGKLHKFKQ